MMKRSKAKALAWKLRGEGKLMPEIAQTLADAGYFGKQGKPLSDSGVRLLLGPLGVRKPRRKSTGASEASKPRRTGDERIDLIKAICAQESMKPADRIAAIMLLT